MTFNEPFFSTGNTLDVVADFSNGAVIDMSAIVPDLSKTGNAIFSTTSGNENLTLISTGLVADRMSFGNAPGAFNPSGTNDTILELVFSEGKISAVPEPASLGLTLGLGSVLVVLAFLRRRRA